MRTRLLAVALGAIAIALVLVASASATPKKPVRTINARYYLALGDSLSVGFQPTANGGGAETSEGYTDQLYNVEKKRIPGLELEEFGCPAETTTSLLTGRGNELAAREFHCDRAGGSQLQAAVRFLKRHHARGEVPLITIDIGANDVDGCAESADVSGCVTTGIGSINSNLPKILGALKRAAPPGTRLVGMNLYDPVLVNYFLPASDPLQVLGEGSVALLQNVNATLQSDDRAAGFRTADVADAFHSYDSTGMMAFNGASIPDNVAYVCAWTWACTSPPVGPNIHANDLGYGVIARAFERAIGRL